MQLTTKITCVGFLLAVSTLTASVTQANSTLPNANLTIESRLSRLTEAMQERGIELSDENQADDLMARGWGDGRGGTWVDTNRGGFANRNGGGSFINRNPWGDRGSFFNRRPWGNGGFINRW
ncbi:GrrA/OscA1 family cyclophane-containing rSAM-modified RiPP [Crocosphaera sp. XPORK-15E]|uniref:GrrA/OscA1 family cyclophane-containing rSAM-modified RiPP n=1 Tax=Crocosphaera sp. XPORK-15E TaxID=3110247 RepID=UPI002B2106C2|nr:GrrA/OscA1 family cyclophane-containing rSAM-modified RiPP [Crocosphaera sp. XPORK-15E]MEA5536344.1 GrrA/OscA1 family cyclophane-containing rSAM-modified RiPP [Crocosphaera sp. XPORK-15E]